MSTSTSLFHYTRRLLRRVQRNQNARAPRKDWLSVGKSACVSTSADAVALRMNPSPRRSLRSGARVSEGRDLQAPETRRVKHVDQIQRHAACAAKRRLAARRSLPRSSKRSNKAKPGPEGCRALSRYRNDDAKRDCCAELQAAATTSRHVVIAAARSTRCD